MKMRNLKIRLLGKKRFKLFFKNKIFNCQVGKNGLTPIFRKREGDQKTPRGKWELGSIFYRKDKFPFIKFNKSILKKVFCITKNCGWCDDVLSRRYNKFLKIVDNINLKKDQLSFENLWRDDDAYDIIIVINYNAKPTIKSKGSAIFLHCSFNDFRPTKGCVALHKNDLKYLCNNLTRKSILII